MHKAWNRKLVRLLAAATAAGLRGDRARSCGGIRSHNRCASHHWAGGRRGSSTLGASCVTTSRGLVASLAAGLAAVRIDGAWGGG